MFCAVTTHPTYDQLLELPAYVEQPVPMPFEDINGHLNVRHYIGIASEGLDESLVEVGYTVYALGARADAESTSLFDTDVPSRVAFVLGGETEGVSAAVADLVAGWVSIPMPGDVESLNVSAAAAVVCFDLVRRGR